ncbi:receptor-like serine/threonine-protein kinase At3g01300 isoform X3 [Durio zibethinus]|uniref:Receptor-like serine/threonine-protein kinase At3g01300 isoform X3 n=1 Tax=Durio zibethinus TaxID=66656 RepID=A0A6P5ZZC6_DURZI|nr:receptor-like serine/threonine-protein kinase At3g01300 isoform X3 [Durio zibethinus]
MLICNFDLAVWFVGISPDLNCPRLKSTASVMSIYTLSNPRGALGNVCSFFVKVVVVLSCAISIINADFSGNLLQAPAQSPTRAPEGAPPVSGLPLPSNLPLIHRPRQRHFSPHSAPAFVAPTQPPLYGPLITASHPPTSSRLSKPLMKRSASAPSGEDLPNIAPTQFSPTALAQPPLSPEVSNCCKPDSILKRGTHSCHCVYPIKLDLLLLNVSQNPNRNILAELASQLDLLPNQIEIINFYVLSLSRLNISMDITPHTGISFSASDASKINSSLVMHRVHFDPNVVGDYKVLNFTWFEPPVPSPVKPRTSDAAGRAGSLPHPSSTRFLQYEELKEATNNFAPASILGEGGFGRVFKGVLSDGTAVAIKRLTSGGPQGDKEFLVEVEMLSRLHHRNLVKLVGYYSSRDSSQNLLCYELVPNGSLEAWLHGPLGINCPLDWDTRMKIALDAARGLAYLHEDSQPCVIHRDFKASNILLENNFHAKVADFGLAKQAPEGRTNYLSTRVMGTFGYVAPEYAMTGHLLVKSDVYSYGVVLLELLTGRTPVDMSQPSGQENLVTWARPILRDKDRLEELADPRLGGKYPKEDFVRVCTIAAACVAPEASQRPTMGEVVQSLKMVQRVTEYQDSMLTISNNRPNQRQSSTTFESDETSSMFSSGPFSGLSAFDNDNISRTAVSSEDLHEGR